MRWEQLALLHWRYRPEEVQALLPDRLTVETYDGSAWVGLVPFRMHVDLPFLPSLRSVLHFPETSVRTYVHDRRGRPGVWVLSRDAASLPAVVTARAAYGVPYCWSTMTLVRSGDRLRYHMVRRRWPRSAGASSLVAVDIGDPFGPGEADDLDHFLTTRWALFGTTGPVLTYSRMDHEPWPLHHAEVTRCDDELVAAAGLPAPAGRPVAHYSPAVPVRSGWPRVVGRAGSAS
jgi:uncharacterized protein YqjF (DUF2071 family)